MSVYGAAQQDIARTLNSVRSAGQAWAAVALAQREIQRGRGMVSQLPGGVVSFLGSFIPGPGVGVTESQAERELAAVEAALERYSARLPYEPTEPVGSVWGSASSGGLAKACADAFSSAFGIEGAVGAQPTAAYVAANLGEDVRRAPAVFVQGVQTVVGGVADAAGGVVNAAIGGVVGQLWWVLALAGVAVWLLIKYGKKLPFKIPLPV